MNANQPESFFGTFITCRSRHRNEADNQPEFPRRSAGLKRWLVNGFISSALIFPATIAPAALTDYGAVPPLTAPNQDQSAANQKLDFHTDLFTGRFAYEVPIVVPPARQSSEPGIALQYSSSAKNGWCGVGWDMDMGFIQRETRHGVPVSGGSFSDSFGFTFSAAGQSGRLIKVAGTNDYRPQIDGGFLKFSYSNGWWVVTDKSGKKYNFGETAASRITNSYGAFRWALSSTRDPNGNKTSITYTNDSGQLYLQSINYNANDNSPAIATNCTVAFDLQTTNRPDISSSVISGTEIKTARLLANVRVLSQGLLVRRYALQYTQSVTTVRSLLQKVTEFGSDNSTSLPAHSFTYQVQGTSFQPETDWPILSQTYPNLGSPYGTSPATPDAQLIDINGDGLPDWVTRPYNQPYDHFQVQLNNGASFGGQQNWTPVSNETSDPGQDWNSLDTADSHLLDLNGDLLPDRVMRQFYSPFSTFKAQLNSGTGFNSVSTLTGVANQNSGYTSDQLNVPFGQNYDTANLTSIALLADINGDGLPDRIMVSATSGRFDVQLNQGGYFGSISSWSSVALATGTGITTSSYYAPRARNNTFVYSELMDLNGDGLADRIIEGGVQLNNGVYGFGPLLSWGLSGTDYPGVLNTTDGDYTSQLIDINGDGLPDLVTYFSSGTFSVRINTGAGFSTTPVYWSGVTAAAHVGNGWNALQAWDANGTRVEYMDMNGDGLPDRVIRFNYQGNPSDYLAVQLNSGPFPDLLSTASNGIGGGIIVAYLPSTAYNNSDGTRSRLPFPVYTVRSVAQNDGRGNSATNSYSYAGGYYDTTYREFRGFAWVRQTDPLGAYTDTYFHQGGGTNGAPLGEFQDDLAKAGMAYRTEVFGSDGKLYSRALNKVAEVQLNTNGVFFPFIQQTIKEDFEGNAGTTAYRATAVAYAYNAISNDLVSSTGNLLGNTNYGEVGSVNISAYTFTTGIAGAPPPIYKQYTYASIGSNPDILDKPASVTVTADGAGTAVLQQTLYQYYGVTGDLQQKSERVCSGTYAVTSYAYDAYGNLVTITDPVGIVSTIDYDSVKATFPSRKYTGPLANNLIEYSQYDARSGAIVAATNLQGLVTANSYDVFFRLTNSAISTTANGAATLTRAKYEYKLAGIVSGFTTNYVRVFRNDPANAATGFHETWSFFDGLGRVIQTHVQSETNGYRQADFAYDLRGNVFLEVYPAFRTNSAYFKPAGTQTNVYTKYDPIGRAFQVYPCASATFSSGNPGTVTVLTGDTGSPVAATSWAFKEGTNVWAIIVTNALGKIHKYYQDAFGRTNLIVEVTSQGNFTNSLAYDQVGNLTNITDSAGNRIAFFYNDLGQKVAMADPDVGFWQYGLDAAGRLKIQTDAKNQQIKLFYDDPAGRLTRREGWNAAAQLVSVMTNQYDSNLGDSQYTVFPGQTFAIYDDEGWQKNSYDVRGRALKTVRYLGKNGQTYTNQFTYDDADRLRSTIYPNGGPTVTNIFDTGQHLSQVKQVGGSNTVFYTAKGFNELEQQTGINFGNGAATTFAYYTTSKRLKQITTLKTTNVQSLTYTFDAIGNVKGVTDGVYAGAASGTLGNISYDDLNRLTSLTNTGGTFAYAYSSIGNVLTNGEFGNAAYNYGTGGIRPHMVRSANGAGYAYDQNGNMAFRSGQRLQYDVNNRLTLALATNGVLTTFGYDANGARLWKSNSTNSLQVWIAGNYEEKNGQVLYHIMAGGKLVCTFDKSGTNVFQYYHPDVLTSTSIQTDQNGIRIQHYEYSAFGRDRFTQSSTAFPVSRRYTRQVLDEDTGLYYYNFRYYDPQLARFIQADDIIPDSADPQSYNRYSYVLNNPLRYTDPSGHADDDDFEVPLTLGAAHAALRQSAGGASAQLYNKASTEMKTDAAIGRAAAELNPVVGLVNSGYQTVTGKDAVDAHGLSTKERILSGVQAAATVAPVALKVGEAVSGGVSIIKNATKEGQVAKEGIYIFKEGEGSYVGQSGNLTKRLKAQEIAGKKAPGVDATIIEVPGGKTAREIAEHKKIQEITGGVPARESTKVTNLRDPIGPNRQSLLKDKVE